MYWGVNPHFDATFTMSTTLFITAPSASSPPVRPLIFTVNTDIVVLSFALCSGWLEGYFSACYTQWVPNSRFDAKYFERFYGKRPVRTMSEVSHLAIAVHEMVTWWNGKIRSVLEVGAGPGDWSNWYRDVHPTVRVVSVDVSEHACKKYGHEQIGRAHV